MENKKERTIYSEQQMKEFAADASKVVMVRTYTAGSSNDAPRPATEDEQRVLFFTIYGGLLSANYSGKVQEAADTAEYIAGVAFGEKKHNETHINAYDCVYNPIKEFFRKGEEAAEEQYNA